MHLPRSHPASMDRMPVMRHFRSHLSSYFVTCCRYRTCSPLAGCLEPCRPTQSSILRNVLSGAIFSYLWTIETSVCQVVFPKHSSLRSSEQDCIHMSSLAVSSEDHIESSSEDSCHDSRLSRPRYLVLQSLIRIMFAYPLFSRWE